MLTIAVAITVLIFLVTLVVNLRNVIAGNTARDRGISLISLFLNAAILAVLGWAYLD